MYHKIIAIILTCLFFFFSPLVPSAESGTSLNKAIDRAGLQRMLTQRMLKSYCQTGQDQFYIKPEEKLSQALQRYEEGLKYLEDFRGVEGVNLSLDKISVIWPTYKKTILDTPKRDVLPELIDVNEKLLALSHQIVLDLQAKSGKKLAKVINVSGRQRMLSQRMELYYLIKNWEFDSYEGEFKKAHNDFTDGLVFLKAYSGNTDEVNQLLSKADKSFKLFNHTMTEKNNAFMISLTTGQMLDYMNQATAIYSMM